MEEKIKKWDLCDQIVARICEINGLTIRDGNLYDKDGNAMLYHDWESVDFADMPVKVTDTESIIAVYLWGDYCLELNVHDGNDIDYGESFNWAEFDNEVLEKVLFVLNNI